MLIFLSHLQQNNHRCIAHRFINFQSTIASSWEEQSERKNREKMKRNRSHQNYSLKKDWKKSPISLFLSFLWTIFSSTLLDPFIKTSTNGSATIQKIWISAAFYIGFPPTVINQRYEINLVHFSTCGSEWKKIVLTVYIMYNICIGGLIKIREKVMPDYMRTTEKV